MGAGALGPVFRAFDPEGDRTVALKSFPLDVTPEQAAEFAAALTRLSALDLDHPALIVPSAAGAEGSTVYLVEDYFVADSLDTAIRQYGPAPVPDALRLVGQLAGALDFAAAAGVHHGALHPRDVLVAPREVRVTGIGVAQALESAGGRVPVRRPYSAPERLERGDWGVAADVFSLAAIAYELLTGRRPALDADALKVDPDAIAVDEKAALSELFARAFSVKPGDRHPTALAFAAGLKHALTGQPLDAPGEPLRPRSRRAASRSGARRAAPALPLDQSRAAEPIGTVNQPRDESSPVVAASEPTPAEITPQTPEHGTDRHDPVVIAPTPLAAVPPPPSTGTEPPSIAEPPPVLDSASIRAADTPHDAGLGVEPSAPVIGPASLDEFDLAPRDAEPVPDLLPPVSEAAATVGPDPSLDFASTPAGMPDETEMRAAVPPPARPEWSSSPPAPRRRVSALALVVMLVVGVSLGLFAGYYVALRRASATPAVAPAQADAASANAPTPIPAEPLVPVPAERVPADAGAARGGVEAGAAQPGVPGSAAGEALRPAATPTPPAGGKVRSGRKESATPGGTRSARTRAAAPRTGAAASRGAASAERTRGAVFQGALAVASKPPGARVLIDGHLAGTTPLALPSVPAGSHVVRLEREGYQSWSSAIQVVAGQQNRVTASLEQRPARGR